MRCHLVVVLAVLVHCLSPAAADDWAFKAELSEKVHEFGPVKVVLQVDAREDQSYPPHTLTIYRDGKPVAIYPNVGFKQLHASPDHRFFVGLSNSGIPGTAVVIFDDHGRLIREVKHDFAGGVLEYTQMSVTVNRTWFNAKNPNVRFEVDADRGRLEKLLVNGSGGQTFDLLESDRSYLYARPRGQDDEE